jgi:hypothetical protein
MTHHSDSPTRRVGKSAILRLCESGSRRLSNSASQGVDDSPTHRRGEFSFKHSIADSLTHWVGESVTPGLIRWGEASRTMYEPTSRILKIFLKFGSVPPTPHMLIIAGWSGLIGKYTVSHKKDVPNIFALDNTTNMILSQQICFSIQIEYYSLIFIFVNELL